MLLDRPTLQFIALANLGMVSLVLLVAAPLGCVPAGGQGCGALLAARVCRG